MLPLLALLLLASLHAWLGDAVCSPGAALGPGGDAEQSLLVAPPGVQEVGGVPCWHPRQVVLACRGLVAYGPGILVLLGYALVLWASPLSLLGLAYLLLLAAVLALPPSRGRWCQLDARGQRVLPPARSAGDDGARYAWALLPPAMREALFNRPAPTNFMYSGNGSMVALLDSPATSWAPLLALAALAGADFAAQAVLPAAAAAQAQLGVPQALLDFLQQVLGLRADAAGGVPLMAQLARPATLLAALAVQRWSFCLGTLHRQAQRQALDAATLARRK